VPVRVTRDGRATPGHDPGRSGIDQLTNVIPAGTTAAVFNLQRVALLGAVKTA
jgi:hypothetical protein